MGICAYRYYSPGAAALPGDARERLRRQATRSASAATTRAAVLIVAKTKKFSIAVPLLLDS
jgi:hypothetical protein